MLERFGKSVVLIKNGKQADSTRFGTGFVIHQDETGSYILTCAHVVCDVGGNDCIAVGDVQAEVVIMGEPDGIDLALLKVEHPSYLLNVMPLILGVSQHQSDRVGLIGYAPYARYREQSAIHGFLSRSTGISNSRGTTTVPAWEVKVDTGEALKGGYSGSPVIDLEQGFVLGVAITREGDDSGRIMSVAALTELDVEKPSWMSGIFRQFEGQSDNRTIVRQNERTPGLLQQRRMHRQEGRLTKAYRNIRKALNLVDFDLAEQMNAFRIELGQHTSGIFSLSVGGVDYGRTRDRIVPRMVKAVKEVTARDLIPGEDWILPGKIQNTHDIDVLANRWLLENCRRDRDVFGRERVEGFLAIYNPQLPMSHLQPIAVRISEIIRTRLESPIEQGTCLFIMLWVNLYAEPFDQFSCLPPLNSLPDNYAPDWLSDRLRSANVVGEDTDRCLKHLVSKIEQTGGNVDVIYQTLDKIALALEKGHLQCLS